LVLPQLFGQLPARFSSVCKPFHVFSLSLFLTGNCYTGDRKQNKHYMEKDIVLLLAGFIVGAMNAIAGGGMLVGFPIMIALGIPPLIANATSYTVTLPGQLASSFGYASYVRRIPKRFALLLIPTTLGAVAGSLTLRHTPAQDFANIIPMLVLFGVVLFALQPVLHIQVHNHLKGRRKTWLPLLGIGIAILPIGFYGGYFGAGYGFLMLAFLGLTSLQDTHLMNSMKNIAAIFVSAAAILCLHGTGLIDWHVGFVMAAGAVAGGFLGARGAQKVSNHWLRVGIITIGLAAAVTLGLRQY
jgi:uncharacterized membrane protein YfcA